jgi:hypothetical protein
MRPMMSRDDLDAMRLDSKQCDIADAMLQRRPMIYIHMHRYLYTDCTYRVNVHGFAKYSLTK